MGDVLTFPRMDGGEWRLARGEWADYRWRLANLYWIVDERGQAVRFRPNATQLDFLDHLWLLNVILKSRQHGFTTLICLLLLDQCVFGKNIAAGIIAHGLREAQVIFRNKIRFAYDRLPEAIKAAVSPVNDSQTELVLSNGSQVYVGASMRSTTLQLLHVSEFGKICARYPEKAREIVTGALNTIHAGQWIFVESTAEGRSGAFYELCERAQKTALEGRPLSKLDFRFHFYPWWKDARNRLDPAGVAIGEELHRYFMDLERDHGVRLDDAQRAWYVKKAETQGDDMKREHPSTPEEAFEAAVLGAVYGKQMALLRARGHIRKVEWVPTEPVNTFWDLGRNDCTAIWFHQHVAGEHRFIRYYENAHEDLAHYVRYLQDTCRGYLWGRHYLPHDANNENLERGESRVDRLDELGLPGEIVVVERVEDINTGIELTRKMLPTAWFDAEVCATGIKALDGYQYEWDERQGTWKPRPAHTWASNGADALRQWGQGYRPQARRAIKRDRPGRQRNWRTA